MKNKIALIIFGIALLLAFLTRYYKLGEAPKGLYIDEAGQGYSAYSILKTGRDEFGKTLPLVFRSFNDFKTPVYIYLVVPLIPIFGLTKFTVRFPSFFFSLLTFPILYLLLKKISSKKLSLPIASISSLLLAISPWHILFGRTNFECNVALFFSLTGIYLFYKGLEKPRILLLSALFFAIAIPSYHAQRVVTPIIMLLLFLRHKKKLIQKTHLPYLILGSILGFVLLFPTLMVMTTPGFLARAAGLNIFSWQRQTPYGFIEGAPFSFLINNPLILSLKEFLSLYFSYFSPRNMFVLGDYGPRSSFPDLSTFFVWQFPFYVFGLYEIVKIKGGEFKFLILSLLLIAPIPAAVTRDPYTSIRALQMVIPQSVIISLGIIAFWNYFKVNFARYALVIGLIFLISWSLLKLYSSVILLNEFYRAQEWDYGWEEVAKTLSTLDKPIPVVVDSARDEPYIAILFFTKFEPEIYQKDNYEVSDKEYYTKLDRLSNWKIGNITVRPIEWKPDLKIKQVLVGDSLAISDDQIREHGLKLIKDVAYPDGSTAFRIVETNP